MNNDILNIYNQIKSLKETKSNSLPSHCFFLDENLVLAKRNPLGDSRHPYSVDGMTLWAYSSGNISLNESNFFILPPELEGKEPYFAIYGGIKTDKKYRVLSLTGAAETEYGLEYDCYSVFRRDSVIYIREIEGLVTAVRISVDQNKNTIFSVTTINISSETKEISTSVYFNPLLTHGPYESEETKWFRTSKIAPYGASFTSVEDLSREVHLYNYAVLKRATTSNDVDVTSSRMGFTGDKNRSVSLSKPLREGKFSIHKDVSVFIDMACYGDIIKHTLKPNEEQTSYYKISTTFNEKELEELEEKSFTIEEARKTMDELSSNVNVPAISIKFGELKDSNIDSHLFNNFLSSVIEQVDYCSRAKNSTIMLLGVRDICQMLEASILWDPTTARQKIINTMNVLGLNGRSPRQYSIAKGNKTLAMDNREFIDQGQWLITTLWTYLAFTNDYSILDEECGFISFDGRGSSTVLDEKSSLFDHLKRILNYLIGHIDPETGLLHTLYGDWNDAVDGLGATKDPNKSFGNGVSIMATEHLYKNLKEAEDIYKIKGEENNFSAIRQALLDSFIKKAIVTNGEETRILHGWGEDKSFFIGGFNDVDGISRISSTSHSFFAISGMIDKHPELKEHILKAYEKLDSKYGYLTFDKYFEKGKADKAGRIVNLPKGTAENAATYIHASMFGVRSLFEMNEGKLAFQQLEKLIPITHQAISTSPFIMPNSYGYNEELGIDGQSMNDWYTGSSNTLIKAVIFDCLGLLPQIGKEIIVKPTDTLPSDSIELRLIVKGKVIKYVYRNQNLGHRKILVNEVETNIIDTTLADEFFVQVID